MDLLFMVHRLALKNYIYCRLGVSGKLHDLTMARWLSNPLRQSLYTLDDCLNGGDFKSLAAAKSLKRIFPAVVIEFTLNSYFV
jgi:hypothetical protein